MTHYSEGDRVELYGEDGVWHPATVIGDAYLSVETDNGDKWLVSPWSSAIRPGKPKPEKIRYRVSHGPDGRPETVDYYDSPSEAYAAVMDFDNDVHWFIEKVHPTVFLPLTLRG